MSHVYSALLEPEPEGGFTVTFPEIGFGAAYGKTWDEALRQAEEMLEEAVLGLIAHGEEVLDPALQNDAAAGASTHRAPTALPALTAAKLEVYRAMRQAGLDEAQLAERLGWPPKKGRPYVRWLPRRPPRTARNCPLCTRPPVRRDIGASVTEQRRG